MNTELKIIYYPDDKLREKSDKVTIFDNDLKELCQNMLTFMKDNNGVGLAAPQVGIKKRIFVMNPTENPENDQIYINPIITAIQGETIDKEGCLSLPNIFINIKRHDLVKINAQDINGNEIELMGTGLVSRIWQHEIDHLDGKLIIDYEAQSEKSNN